MNKERRQKIDEIVKKLEDIVAELDELMKEELDAFYRLPESIQYSERGELMGAAVDELEDISGKVMILSERLEDIINA